MARCLERIRNPDLPSISGKIRPDVYGLMSGAALCFDMIKDGSKTRARFPFPCPSRLRTSYSSLLRYHVHAGLSRPVRPSRYADRGENRPTWIQSRHFECLGREVGIKPRLIERIIDEMSKKILPTVDAVARDFAKAYNDCAIVEKILDVIKNNSR